VRAGAADRAEQSRIDALRAAIEGSGCRFERNGTHIQRRPSAAHLRNKLESAGDGFKTAGSSSEHIGTASSQADDLIACFVRSARASVTRVAGKRLAEISARANEPPSGGMGRGRCPGALSCICCSPCVGLIEVKSDFRSSTVAEGGMQSTCERTGSRRYRPATQVHGHDWSNAFPPSQICGRWRSLRRGLRSVGAIVPSCWRPRLGAFPSGTALEGAGRRGPGPIARRVRGAAIRLRRQRLLISREQHVRLVAAIRRSFRRGADGSPIRIDAPVTSVTTRFNEAIRLLAASLHEWVRSV